MNFSLTEKFLQFTLLGAEWVLWLLVVLSIISVYVMIERLMFFRTVSGADANVGRALLDALIDRDFDRAANMIRNSVGTGARMVAQMLGRRDSGNDAMQASMHATRAEEKIRLERNISFLGTLGANAPFIGLFGTVLGIIRAFKDLADTGLQPGADQSTAVMTGISEALVATAVGLLVAIPAVIAYNLFMRRVKRTLAEAEALANNAFAVLAGDSNGEPAAAED